MPNFDYLVPMDEETALDERVLGSSVIFALFIKICFLVTYIAWNKTLQEVLIKI